MGTGSIQALYRYPVKGLSPEPLMQAWLSVGETIPGDRLYAIENGPSGFDPTAPRYQPKTRYLMLMRNERLALLRASFDDASHRLVLRLGAEEVARGELRAAQGRAEIERFLAGYCRDELRGPPKILHAPGFSFSDVAAKVISIINLASVADLERRIDAVIDPLRFRANVYVAGWPAWQELDMVGRTLTTPAGARLAIVKRIVRCAATNVDPLTGQRDLAIPETLLRTFGHCDCGVYARVVASGLVRRGDGLS
ncbi:MAG: MOSC domain-containing protein [Hyphomicrobiales bacterium]|nr:MOSC domain-containing protein [Hyphomicrobiales bacterium]